MDEIQSDSHNNLIDHVNGERKKKKKKKRDKSETTDQQELTENSNVHAEKRHDKTHERKKNLKESDSSLQTPTGKNKKRKLDEEGQTSMTNILFVSSKTTPLKDFQREVDEIQSDFLNDSTDHVIGEKKKKKKRREKSETTDEQELIERSEVQTEKRHDETYDSKNTSKESHSCLETPTSKKKKRKLDKYETSIMDIGVVSSEASPLKDFQYEMDEIQSDSCNNLLDCVNGEKRKKKKKSKTTDQQELNEDSNVQSEKLHEETHERNYTSKDSDSSLHTPTSKSKKRKLYKEGETSVTDVGVVSSEASPLKDFQCEMDEIQSDSQNTLIEHVNGEKRKKKKKRREKSEITDQQELIEDSNVQTEKCHDKMHKRKNSSKESDISLHTLNVTSKKKKRKLNEEGETSMTDDGSNLPQINNKKNKLQEQQDSSQPTPSKKKKKRANAESAIKTEHEEVPSTSEQEPAALVGTKRLKKNQNSLSENLVDAKLLNELREFVPNITSKNRSSHEINKMIRYDLPRFKEFKKQGIALRRGKYSDAENERLRQNVSDFLALTGVKDAIRLFHPKRYPEEMQALTKLKRNQKFFQRIAEGIPRLCHDVFNRGTKVFDDRNNKGCFSKEEDKLLLKYYQLHGTNWKKISELTDRSAYSLEKRYAHIIVAKKSGAWSTKEIQRLLRAVRDHIVSVLNSNSSEDRAPKIVSREMLYQKLPWSNIAMKVKTRCWSKCREKWMSILTGRMSSVITVRGRKAKEDKIRLIKVMYEIQAEDVADVNWEDVTSVYGNVPPAYAQSKWHQLKVSYVPDWKSKSFGDIVDFLYEKIMPELMKECQYFDNNECRVDQKQSFLLSDIFHDIEEDCSDSDEETGQTENINST